MRVSSIWLLLVFAAIPLTLCSKCTPLTPKQFQRAEQAARQWAPLVWLAPEERYFPSSVLDFLAHTRLRDPLKSNSLDDIPLQDSSLPVGPRSKKIYLETTEDLESLLANSSSILHGHSPMFYSVPVYAVISACCPRHVIDNNEVIPFRPHKAVEEYNATVLLSDDFDFEITYWLFFPYSEGKRVCTMNAGALGPLPIPWLRTACLGRVRSYGSHVGDWEHVTLAFRGSAGEPSAMYVSTHEAGALYSLPPETQQQKRGARTWTYSGHELRRGGRLLQNPRFPRHGFALHSGRPVLFAAKGSHGLWTLPGRHKYVTFPNLEDETGFGTAWRTWQNLQVLAWPIIKGTEPRWLNFQGHWGNPRSGCHPLSQQVCQITDGPQGIPMKKHAFRCLNTHALLQIKPLPAINIYSNKIIY